MRQPICYPWDTAVFVGFFFFLFCDGRGDKKCSTRKFNLNHFPILSFEKGAEKKIINIY